MTMLDYKRNTKKALRLDQFYFRFNRISNKSLLSGPDWPAGTKTHLKSLFPDGSVRYNEVLAVYDSGFRELVKLCFENGSHLYLTPDHPIATPSGEFLPAESFSEGDFVLAQGSLKARAHGGKNTKHRPLRIIVNTRFHPGPEKWVNGCRYVRVPRARLVVEATMNRISYEEFVQALKKDPLKSEVFAYLPQELDVHHKDENPLNDSFDNLEVLTHSGHALEHSKVENLKMDWTRELKIIGIAKGGVERTFDIQMASPANNFVANGVIVHNTGKTELVRRRCESDRGYGVLASTTGISAMNLGTRTLNSLLTYFNTESLDRKARNGKLSRTLWNLANNGILGQNIIIDEVSMMEADQLDILTRAMESAFRGARGIVVTGDFAQLPPIEGKFAFEAESWPLYESKMTALTKIWRQSDEKFLNALALIRRGDSVEGARCLSSAGAEFADSSDSSFDGITLVPTNREADEINASQVAKLPGLAVFVASRKGKDSPEWGLIPGATLVKPGAKIMITANDSEGLCANGDLGIFLNQVGNGARVRLDRTGLEIIVGPVTRKNLDYSISPEGKWIGEISFMPIKLAWAMTIHKSQGLTIPKVQLHIKHWFAGEPALVYVACSRVREASQLKIVGTVQELMGRIKAHPEVTRWL